MTQLLLDAYTSIYLNVTVYTSEVGTLTILRKGKIGIHDIFLKNDTIFYLFNKGYIRYFVNLIQVLQEKSINGLIFEF